MASTEAPGPAFAAVTWDDWVAAVGGDEAAARLATTTEDGLVLAPVYPARGGIDPGYPGLAARVRGRRAGGTGLGGWDVRALHGDPDPSAANRAILDDLERGATSLLLRVASHPAGGLVLAGPDDLGRVLAGVHLDLAPVALDAGTGALEAFAALEAVWDGRGVPAPETRGAAGLDPVAASAAAARTSGGDPVAVLAALELAARVDGARPRVFVLTSDGPAWSLAGATDAQELALLLATGADLLRAADDAGVDAGVVARRFEARVTVGADQFAAIAKVRAARRLWQALTAASGVSEADQGLRVHALAAEREWTRRDPWVNVLRATVAAFAAGVAGADSVTVLTHDHARGGPSDLARRLARNVSTILIEEAGLGRVIDPAGGSPYVEARTEALAGAAWERFRAIERDGGAARLAASGQLVALLDASTRERSRRVATRSLPVTGVSEYADPAEGPPPPLPEGAADDGRGNGTDGLPRRRLAEGFEALRDAADAHTQRAGERPAVTLATIGPLARHAARATWATNLLAAGGLAARPAPVAEVGAVPLAVLCGDDDGYAAEAAGAARALKAAGVRELWLAGRAGDAAVTDELREAGVDRFVRAGVDALDVLQRAHEVLGVAP